MAQLPMPIGKVARKIVPPLSSNPMMEDAMGGDLDIASIVRCEPMELSMQTLNDLSRSLIALEPASTLIAVIGMSLSSWLVAGVVPGIERQPLKKLAVDESALLRLLRRWREEAEKAGCRIERIATTMIRRDAMPWRRWTNTQRGHQRRQRLGGPCHGSTTNGKCHLRGATYIQANKRHPLSGDPNDLWHSVGKCVEVDFASRCFLRRVECRCNISIGSSSAVTTLTHCDDPCLLPARTWSGFVLSTIPSRYMMRKAM
jgi:hypothetical protein